jgi:hypothetical protein
MNKPLIQGLISRFIQSYDSAARENIWQKQSAAFRQFWSQRVLAQDLGKISDDDCDVIIRILDRSGKGNTKDSHAVAKVFLTQNKWRNLFNNLHSDQKLGHQVDSIFRERNVDQKVRLIDELYRDNADGKKWLTGEGGNVLNAFLAAYDPLENLMSVALKHRKSQLDFLEAKLPFDWSSASVGSRIVYSNLLIRENACALGLENSALTITAFLYFEPVFELWHSQDTVKRTDKEVIVTVPQNTESETTGPEDENELRESLQVQAALAEIGSHMGFQIWLPRADRSRVLTKWKPEPGVLLENLPVGFDQATMKTVEQIDVLWLKRRSIVRAFEVEHTTSVYSGILRMADLLAMQPNLKISLHIVAPASRREKVFQEIRRPVFALLEGGALSYTCTYLSYDTVADLRGQQHLGHLSDKVLEDYEEKVEDAD